MTFEEAALLPRSEKITLVTIEAAKQVKLFDLYSGSTYSKSVDNVVSRVFYNGAELTIGTDRDSLTGGQFYFSPIDKKLYLYSTNEPSLNKIIIYFKFFFSNAPLILPNDLGSGYSVEWLPLINKIGSIGQRLDDENTGIVLESTSSIDLINNDGFFDPIFDALIWENKQVRFYYWFPITPITEAKKVFEGVIGSKDFSSTSVSFRINDFIFKLRNILNLELFTALDGFVPDSLIGKPKRRIYGRADKVKCAPIDIIGTGYNLTGTHSLVATSKTLTGVGSSYLSQLFTGDEIILTFNSVQHKFTVELITSNTVATLSKESDLNITSALATIRPEIPFRKKNRRWHIAGHKLTSSVATILNVIDSRTFLVDDNKEFFQGDIVTINGTTTSVDRVSGSQIILEQFIFPVPVSTDEIVKDPVLSAYYGNQRLILNRDFTITNTTEAILELDELAEFNVSTERTTGSAVTLTFTVSDRNITTASAVDLRTLIKPKDWIRSTVQSSDVWYEIATVYEKSIVLVGNYTQTTNTNIGRIKQVDIVGDESLITVDCYGIQYEGKWVKDPSDAVKHMVKFDAGFTNIDIDSFEQAKADGNFTMSLIIPDDVGQNSPSIKDSINKVNDSVFGSLYGNSTQQIAYSIVNSRRPVDSSIIRDDDILSWSSDSINTIVNKVVLNYAPFVDFNTGENSFKVITFNSEFVNSAIGIETTKEITSYIYEDSKAIVIAQRAAFYNSLSKLKITLKGKANFFSSYVNDRIYLKLDRMFGRFGSGHKAKIAIVSGVSLNATDSEITINDMGNIFNRNPVIAPSAIVAFSSSTEDDNIKYGYILDNDKLVPDVTSEKELGNCLIG